MAATKMIAVGMWMVRSGLCYRRVMRGLLLSIFPATVLGLATLDRALTYALPAHAASAEYWETWRYVRELIAVHPFWLRSMIDAEPLVHIAMFASLFALLILVRRSGLALLLANAVALNVLVISALLGKNPFVLLAIGATSCLAAILHFVRSRRASRIYRTISRGNPVPDG